MANRKLNPKRVHRPLSKYTHGVLVRPGTTWLHISGQVGIDANGKLARSFKAQCNRAYRNLLAVLAEADMTVNDLVKVSVFLTRPQDIADYRAIRDKMQDRARPASTLLVVQRLASPDFLVEIEAVAAKG